MQVCRSKQIRLIIIVCLCRLRLLFFLLAIDCYTNQMPPLKNESQKKEDGKKGEEEWERTGGERESIDGVLAKSMWRWRKKKEKKKSLASSFFLSFHSWWIFQEQHHICVPVLNIEYRWEQFLLPNKMRIIDTLKFSWQGLGLRSMYIIKNRLKKSFRRSSWNIWAKNDLRNKVISMSMKSNRDNFQGEDSFKMFHIAQQWSNVFSYVDMIICLWMINRLAWLRSDIS